jgi:hypothetical protein
MEAVVSKARTPASQLMAPVKLRLPTGAWIEVTEVNQVSLAAALARALGGPLAPC